MQLFDNKFSCLHERTYFERAIWREAINRANGNKFPKKLRSSDFANLGSEDIKRAENSCSADIKLTR